MINLSRSNERTKRNTNLRKQINQFNEIMVMLMCRLIFIFRFDFTHVFYPILLFRIVFFFYFLQLFIVFLQFSPYAPLLDFTVLSNAVTYFTKELK